MDKGYNTLYAVLYIYLDKEYLLPTRTEGYDTAGNLISCYRYLDVRFNRGLTDQLFSPRANGLDG
jgi:outer membrane lipoprotein-sorting protein